MTPTETSPIDQIFEGASEAFLGGFLQGIKILIDAVVQCAIDYPLLAAVVVFIWAFPIVKRRFFGIKYREAYQARQLLTNRELKEYQKLKQYADARNWLICPKVRLFDLIEPKSGYSRSDRQKLMNKVWAKHVDFVLVNQQMQVIGVLELDDSTHDRPDRQERDRFVRDALEGAGITLVQTRCITPETLDGFTVQS